MTAAGYIDCCTATVALLLASGTPQRCECGAHLRLKRDPTPPLAWLEHLARWLPTIEGSAMSIEPQIRGARDGRSDYVDERHHQLQRALAAHRHLATLPERHRAVLAYAYVRLGAEARGRESDLHDALGWAFVTREQRAKWLKLPKAIKREAPRKHGRELLVAALAAWEG